MSEYYTIPGFAEMTEQAIFDMAVEHIGRTRQKSTNGNGKCAYSGSGCNAAPLLREVCRELADNQFDNDGEVGEGSAWIGLVKRGMVPYTHQDFVSKLQLCHDHVLGGVGFVENWKRRMEGFARIRNLDTTKLDAIAV